MFRKPKFIVSAAAVLYAVAMAFAWREFSAKAETRVLTMLESAESGFSAIINGEIEAALRNVGGALINVFAGECKPRPLTQMQDLARTFNLDEINIVNRHGVTIASNFENVLGFNFNLHPLTRQFMALTNETVSMVSQPFRQGVANPEISCQYYGMAFPQHDGFLQVGVTVERLRQNMYSYSDVESDRVLKEWHFSVVGWYERAVDDPEFRPGKMIRRWSDVCGEITIGRYFEYHDYPYFAQLPVSYCYAQRNSAFAVTAAVVAALLAFFTFILVKLTRTSAKLEAMHAAAEARTAADLALARTIQMSALPTTDGAFMERMDFSLSAECHPAREVGGDFYDFFHMSGERIALLVADVSGKGIPGAMFMMEAKNVLKNCLAEHTDVAEAVAEANRRLCAANKAELFVTVWVGVMDRTGTFEYVNAGHNRPFIRRSDGTIEKLMGKGGRFLGMFEDATYRSGGFKLERGDILFLYTDGVTEAMNVNGEQFGEKRLREVFTGYNMNIAKELSAFVGAAEPSDDMTGLLLRWNGEMEARQRNFSSAESSLSAAVEFIRGALAGEAPKTLAMLLNAADEITSNIVSDSGASSFSISVERGYDRVRIVFADDGMPYNPLSHTDPDIHATIEKRPIGGLGLVVVKHLVDSLAYSRENGRNVLSLIKRTEFKVDYHEKI